MNEKSKVVCQNKRATFDYYITETYTAGIVLLGTEIKSIRLGKATFNNAYCEIKNNEMFLIGLHISKYEMGNIFNHDPDRIKKLLLNKREILKLVNRKSQDGYTIVPLKVILVEGLAKVVIGVAKGKKLYDKRDDIKKQDELMYIKKVGRRWEDA